MNHHPYYRDPPQEVTFFIGPIGAGKGEKTYEAAVKLADQGDRRDLNDFLEIQNETLRKFAGHSPEVSSPLRQLLSEMLDRELGPVSTFVGTGFMKGVWTPTLTIYLDRSKGADGTPLKYLLRKNDGEAIADVLCRGLKADWIYTTWTCPGEPIDLVDSALNLEGKSC